MMDPFAMKFNTGKFPHLLKNQVHFLQSLQKRMKTNLKKSMLNHHNKKTIKKPLLSFFFRQEIIQNFNGSFLLWIYFTSILAIVKTTSPEKKVFSYFLLKFFNCKTNKHYFWVFIFFQLKYDNLCREQ